MPTVYRLIDEKRTFLDGSGNLLAGGKLYTYTTGTTTPKDTYTENDGVTTNANPIILNSRGEVPNGVYGTTGAYKLVLKDSSDVTIWTRDDVDPINDVPSNAIQTEWTTYDAAPTYISATSFSVAGDQTATFHVGRRVRTTNSGGTLVYSTIATSSFAASITTLTLTNDSGSLNSGLSAVAYGVLSATNGSIPALVTVGTAVTTPEIRGATVTLADADGTDRWTKDSSGRLLNVANSQPSFLAIRTSNQTSGTTVIFDAVSHEHGGNIYDETTGVFTAPVAGLYQLNAVIHFTVGSGSNDSRWFSMECSSKGRVGTAHTFVDAAVNNNAIVSGCISAVVDLALNETVSITVSSALTAGSRVIGDTNPNSPSYNSFSAYLLG